MTRQIGRSEIADRSTIFLDEIGELPLEVQAKLPGLKPTTLDSRMKKLGITRPRQITLEQRTSL